MSTYTQTSLRKRSYVFIAVVLVILSALGGRLLYIQLLNGHMLQLRAREQWYRDLPLGSRRGNILDRNGVIMVESVATFSVYVRPVAITDPEQVATVLSRLLNMPYQFLYGKVTSRTVSEWLIRMQVPKSTAMQIVSHEMDGVFLSQTYRRTYPLGAVGGQVLGMVSVDNRGQEGIEAFYDSILRGTDGRIARASDLRGIPIPNGTEFFLPATPGFDLTLNIDSVIQNILQTQLARAYWEQGAVGVSGLVMCIQTGGIVASASAPFFDMNSQPRDCALTLMTQIKNLPMVNVLEPGSTFKILTLAIAIELGLVDESETFNCPGFRVIDGERVKCWRTKGHGVQDLVGGVKSSCNAVFMDLALRIGVERYYEFMKRFGIGSKTGVDFYGEPSGLVLPIRYVRPVDLARIGFGHAVAVSPIQFQAAINAIIGDGILRTPRFAHSVPTAGTTIDRPIREQRVISAETSRRVRDIMIQVVDAGSGRHSQVSGFQVGGKTGTAQKYVDGVIAGGKYISSFISFINVNGVPRYSVFFYVDEPSKMGYYGSIVAAPYVGYIFRDIVAYLDLSPDPQFYKPSATPDQFITLPSVAGLTTFNAVSRLQSLGVFVQVSGEGFTATGTFPAAGSRVLVGQPVVIRT